MAAPVKAVIEPEGGAAITLLFNPGQYGLNGSNQFAEAGVPGRDAPILQFVRGGGRSLSLELFFDTFEARADVRRQYTDKIYGLMRVRAETHRPPLCTFRWGEFSFRCVVERVDGRFTLFLGDGTPVRATLSVTLKEAAEVTLEDRHNELESADRTKTHTVKRGEALHTIAAAEYGDPAAWRAVAEANGIDSPLELEPGTRLVLPRLAPSAAVPS